MTDTSRNDGRQPGELRPFSISWDPMGFALSSVIIHSGRTAVLCSVCHQEGVPRWRKDQGQGWLSAEYRLLPGSTPERQNRELLKLSGRTQEIQRLIGRSLRAAINMEALGENTLRIDCDVIQADGGTRTASITGACVALVDAIRHLQRKKAITGDPLVAMIASVSVGVYKGTAVLDLDYPEDSNAETDMNVVMNSDGGFIEVQGTAEAAPFSAEELNQMLDLAKQGIADLVRVQQMALAQ